MKFNIFGIDFDLSVTSIVQFILDNKAALIPGILYLIFNQLISPYIIIGIIGKSYISRRFSTHYSISKKYPSFFRVIIKIINHFLISKNSGKRKKC